MDARLQKRYLRLVESHMNTVQAVAAGIKALPGVEKSFAATQAAWRFFANPRVTLAKLIEPLREVGRQACDESPSPDALIVHDWSKMDYDGHQSKTDLTQLSQALDRGYEQSHVVELLQQEGAFERKGEVSIRGRKGQQWVAETEIVLDQPAWGKTPAGKTCRVPGPALGVRLVVVQVRDAQGNLLAEWLLLTNVTDVSAQQLAQWYYWRWRIESFHKLLKSAGLELEEWQQESAAAITKRLLIGCMACVTVWALQRLTTPEARECQNFLVRLSGRQTKRSRPVTAPALLAGLHLLLTMLDVLKQYTPAQLREYAHTAAPMLCRSG